MRHLCAAPAGKRGGCPRQCRGVGKSAEGGQAPGAKLSARPPPKWRMRTSLARLLPPALAMAFTPAPSRTGRAQPPIFRAGLALPHLLILFRPLEGERVRSARPASSRCQFVSTTRSSVPGEIVLACARSPAQAAGAISSAALGGSGGIRPGSPGAALLLTVAEVT